MSGSRAVWLVVGLTSVVGIVVASAVSGELLAYIAYLPTKVLVTLLCGALFSLVGIEALKFIWTPTTRAFIKTFTYVGVGLYSGTVFVPPLIAGAAGAHVEFHEVPPADVGGEPGVAFDAKAAWVTGLQQWTASPAPTIMFIAFLGFLLATFSIYLWAQSRGF